MSLSDEERSIVVELEMEKAHVAYNETIWLMEKESWSGAAGRLYYALFHIHDRPKNMVQYIVKWKPSGKRVNIIAPIKSHRTNCSRNYLLPRK